ncbi:MAG: ribosomal RNA small subunit methyltransferase I, partial [Betaproteobacteria bacterium]
TPYRNAAMLQAALQCLKPTTLLAISSGLTLDQAMSRSDRVSAWKQRVTLLDKHTPAVFGIGV